VVRVDNFCQIVRLCGGIGGFCLVPNFGHSEPIVFVWLIGDPRREGHAEVIAESRCVSFVESPQIAQTFVRLAIAANTDTALTQ